MNKYEWKLKSFAKGIDPDRAVEELERIESVYGSLTPENILAASESKDAVLHSLFMWNNKDAAIQYRLQQARILLNNVQVQIISNGETRNISIYEVVRINDERVYKNIKDFTKTDIEQVRSQTIRELNSIKQKLYLYNDFNEVISKIDEAVELIK